MKTLEQLEDNLGAVGWTLTGDEMERSFFWWNTNNIALNVQDVKKVLSFMKSHFNLTTRLDAASTIPAPYPYEMINRLNKGRRRL